MRKRNAELPSSYPRGALLSRASANAFSPATDLFALIPTVRRGSAQKDMMHSLLIERADALVGCAVGSDEEAELERLTIAIEAYEAKRWPSGKAGGGKGLSKLFGTSRTSMAAAPLSKYAAPVEVKMLAKAMRQRLKSMGRDSRSLSKDSHVYWQRKCIERGLKALRRGELPIHLEDYAGVEDLLAFFHVRYSTAQAEGREPVQTPTPDAAWIAKLESALRSAIED